MFIADFHIHSKYSRATSRECVPEMLELWARRKGLALIGTGDFTHPAWREELKEKLVYSEDGLYRLKAEYRRPDDSAGAAFDPRFVVSGEISSIYKKNGKVRKVHNLILLPGIEQAETLAHRLEAIGNLHSDGRPILGLDSRDLLEITLEVCSEALFIPAHIWTPHFSLFGAYSGFDAIEECFEDLTGHIHALETGLSSNPPMNWRLSALDKYTLVSNSDAHSPGNLAREANIFAVPLSYPHIARALQNPAAPEFYGTIEFFPEEGKYHYDGHRRCKVCLEPMKTTALSGVCPVCGGKLTVGVLHRVEALADRAEGFVPPSAKHFESLVPLREVIAASTGLAAAGVKAYERYCSLLRNLGPELFILREAPLDAIEEKAGPLVAEGIQRLRCGKLRVEPGYDGEYGKISILAADEIDRISGQTRLFEAAQPPKQSKVRGAHKENEPPAAVSPQQATATTEPAPPANLPYGLNQEQWEAVAASDRAVMVTAGPGTGKTRTLVSRIIYLIEQGGVQPAQITAVTFTSKAAKEMRARLEKHFGGRRPVNAMTVGTFHSIALAFLTEQNGGKNVIVIDEANALSIVNDILTSLHLKNSPRDVLRGISLIKNGAVPGKTAAVPAGVYDSYCAQLERYGVLDYDDILLQALDRFTEQTIDSMDAARRRNSFTYLLVDELQDINSVQYRLIKTWSRSSAGVFVIGDPDQSIYGFRGSDLRYFEQLPQDFPATRQVRLTQNYRSTPEIIRCAQSVMTQAAAGRTHLLTAKKASGAKVRRLETPDDLSEAIFVAKEINRMVGGTDMLNAHTPPARSGKKPAAKQLRAFSEIAVLYRTNRQAEILEKCLSKEGIPFKVAGRDEFLTDVEVQKATAFFRFLLNPADRISLRVCLKTLSACPADLSRKLLAAYDETEKNIDDLAVILGTYGVTSAAANTERFIKLLRKYEAAVHTEKPQKLLKTWTSDNGLNGVRSVELLSNLSVGQDKMAAFLQNLALGHDSDIVRSGNKVYAADAVSLMTFHGAKGLEFPVVFLCGLNQGILPYRNYREDSNPDEERRLLYVGLTRAQEELLLLSSPFPSPFLGNIPEDILVREEAFTRKLPPAFQQLGLFDR